MVIMLLQTPATTIQGPTSVRAWSRMGERAAVAEEAGLTGIGELLTVVASQPQGRDTPIMAMAR
jgi:hypothetical protein